MRGFVRSVAKAGVHKHHKHDDKHAEAGMGTANTTATVGLFLGIGGLDAC